MYQSSLLTLDIYLFANNARAYMMMIALTSSVDISEYFHRRRVIICHVRAARFVMSRVTLKLLLWNRDSEKAYEI